MSVYMSVTCQCTCQWHVSVHVSDMSVTCQCTCQWHVSVHVSDMSVYMCWLLDSLFMYVGLHCAGPWTPFFYVYQIAGSMYSVYVNCGVYRVSSSFLMDCVFRESHRNHCERCAQTFLSVLLISTNWVNFPVLEYHVRQITTAFYLKLSAAAFDNICITIMRAFYQLLVLIWRSCP